MDLDKYLEGQSMQRPPLFESDHFIYWKNRFETYVKAKDLDLWHIILNGDFPPLAKNEVTQILEVVPFEEQSDDLKKKLAKNNEAKMVLYNALPKKEYERIFMCKTAKDIWQSLLITHQGNSQRAKVTGIEESKDLSSLALDELISNLKVHEVVMEKDSEIYKGKKERVKSIALKAKKESSDDETSTSGSDDEEYAMAVRNFKKFFRRKGKFVRQPREEKKSFRQRDEKKGKSDRKCFRCGDPNHLIGDCPKPTRNKDQKAFIGGSWSDSENDAEDKTNDETCLMAQSSNEVTLNSSYYSDNASSRDNDTMQIEYDSFCEISLKIINNNKTLKNIRDLLEKEVFELNEKIKKLERSKEIDIACLGFGSSKASTSGTKLMGFVGSSAEKATDGSTIKAHGSTIPGSVCLSTCLELDEWIKDSGFSKYMTGDKSIFSTYKAYDGVIMEYLVNISKRSAFCSINKDILKITILKTNTPYPSRKIRRIRACTHQRPQGMKINTPYPEDSICRIQDMESIYYYRIYQTWSLLQEIHNMPYPTEF
ncbi:zf-CCHC domain-containing protein [Tanacetum coccineum]